jgi:hypothetical protein
MTRVEGENVSRRLAGEPPRGEPAAPRAWCDEKARPRGEEAPRVGTILSWIDGRCDD